MLHLRRSATSTVALIATVATTIGFLVAATPLQVPAAAVEPTEPAMTVKWAGGNDESIEQYQVDHEQLLSDGGGNDSGTGHWDDFKDLEISVSKTTALRDEAVVVTASGMAPTSFGESRTNAPSSFLQVMQCWGPDPLAADFAETCQYGAWNGRATLGRSTNEMAGIIGQDASGRGAYSSTEVPFRAVTGQKSEPSASGPNGETLDGTAQFFDASTSNEQPIVYVEGDGTARSAFTVQTAASQPYLGCGGVELAGLRCWLVIVPRGTHSGALEGQDEQTCIGPVYGGKPAGETTFSQIGSPLSPSCAFFQNRIVVPLDFADQSSGCAPGSPESRVLGSELISEAMASWQRGLCADAGIAYSLTTNAGDVTRNQLLTGRANVAVVANPFTPTSIGADGAGLLDEADIVYAPVANAALTVSFVASDLGGAGDGPPKITVFRDIKMTPRLLAKALTQSYKEAVPYVDGRFDFEVLPGRASFMAGAADPADPEWLALGNPKVNTGGGGQFVVSGPQGEDVVELLWRYIQADADAAAFLRGEPDPWGQRINPHYLPAKHPDAAGGGLPFDLAVEPIDTFLKADQTLAPSKADAETYFRGLRIDSVTMLPYSSSLSANAARIIRADTKFTNTWNPTKQVGVNETGAWDPAPAQIGGSKFVAGPTDAASAARYGVDSAHLPLPLSQITTKETIDSARTWVAPDEAGLSAAARAWSGTGSGIQTADFAALPDDAYPLTAVLYAAVNVADSTLDAGERSQITTLLDYVVTAGNTVGDGPGQLPRGYAPLTEVQTQQTRATMDRIGQLPSTALAATVPVAAPPAPNTVVQDTPATVTSTTQADTTAAEATPAGAAGPQAALGVSLLAGVAGLIASPFLLRRRLIDG